MRSIILVAPVDCQCQNFQRLMRIVADQKLDCLGLFCPMPILKTRDAMKHMTVGQVLEMTSDDPASETDMITCAARTAHELLKIARDSAVFRVLVRKTR